MTGRKEQEPIEFEDDYEIDLRENIDDESETEGSGSLKFAITSYGADYPVETIVGRLNSDAFYVPPFQRNFVWSQGDQGPGGVTAPLGPALGLVRLFLFLGVMLDQRAKRTQRAL